MGVGAVVRRPSHRADRASSMTEILVVQRGSRASYADGYGTWGLPGGWLEFGEDPFVAAMRETEEETGVAVRALEQDGYTANVSASGRLHIVTLFVTCGWIAGEPVNLEPDKQMDVRWVLEDQLGERDLFAPLDAWWRRPRVPGA